MSEQHSVTTLVCDEVYANVMETLIAEAVDRRLAKLSPQEASYVKRVQVITYALNRVPPLYAASKEGFDRQCKRARLKFAEDIKVAVNQAFAAIQRDPLKTSTPLYQDRDETLVDAEEALEKIRAVFDRDDLSWSAVANWVVRAVQRRGVRSQRANLQQQVLSEMTMTERKPNRREPETQHVNVRIYRGCATDTQLPLEDSETPPISAWGDNPR